MDQSDLIWEMKKLRKDMKEFKAANDFSPETIGSKVLTIDQLKDKYSLKFPITSHKRFEKFEVKLQSDPAFKTDVVSK